MHLYLVLDNMNEKASSLLCWPLVLCVSLCVFWFPLLYVVVVAVAVFVLSTCCMLFYVLLVVYSFLVTTFLLWITRIYTPKFTLFICSYYCSMFGPVPLCCSYN